MSKVSIHCSILIILLLSSCTYRYHSSVEGIEKIPCFSDNAIGKHYRNVLNNDDKQNINMALDKVNQIFIDGMFPFLFLDKYNKYNADNCTEYEKKADIRAFVSLNSQPIIKETPKSQGGKETAANISTKDISHIENIIEEYIQKKTAASVSSKLPLDSNLLQKSEDKYSITPVKLIVSSYLYSLNPADRLEKVYTLIVPFDNTTKFVEVGDVQFLNVPFGSEKDVIGLSSTDFTVGTSKDKPIQLTPSFTRTLERNIAKKYAILNAEIFPLGNVMLISQDGGPANAEIRGNVAVVTKIIHKTNKNDIYALVASVAVVRKVIVGEDTIKEDDDTIKYVVFPSVVISNIKND